MPHPPRKVKKNRCGIIVPHKYLKIKTPGWAFFVDYISFFYLILIKPGAAIDASATKSSSVSFWQNFNRQFAWIFPGGFCHYHGGIC